MRSSVGVRARPEPNAPTKAVGTPSITTTNAFDFPDPSCNCYNPIIRLIRSSSRFSFAEPECTGDLTFGEQLPSEFERDTCNSYVAQ